MYKNGNLLIGKNDKKEVNLLLNMSNRHGLITGASGTGKTITSKVMAEGFSDAGVPVFMADVKGDLSGTAEKGIINEKIQARIDSLKLEEFEPKAFPVRFWDVYRVNGIPVRFKVSDVGPNILSMMLGLSEAQEGVLNILFSIAEDEGIQLDDLKDLKYALNYIGENRSNYTLKYGNITTQSIGVILRSLNTLENQGLDKFFGIPSLNIFDFISINENGKGIINILDAVELYKNPDLYSTVMLCLLTNLYDQMPEIGDVDKPKIVFFFDEAYFLFREMPSYRLKQIEKIVRLVRSKGIGLYFITHYTTDIPDMILEQLGNRVQHNLRAYTPADQKVAKAAADSFRANPNFNTYDTILELGTGEALVSFQNEKGEPEIVEKVTILPPQSIIGVISPESRKYIIESNKFFAEYKEDKEEESAYEKINKINEARDAEIAEIEKAKAEAAAKKEEERLAKEEAKKKAAEEREKAKKEREEEKAKKNSWQYKLGKKATNKVIDKSLNKGISAIFKGLFK
ncbi:MAG: DUF853 family protein [Bacilli bacterium]|nr:DUF853 family protein [Bacilli bacterium]